MTWLISQDMQGVEHRVGRIPERPDAEIAAARKLNADAVYGVGARIIAGVVAIEQGSGARPVLEQIIDRIMTQYKIEVGLLPRGASWRGIPLSTMMPALLGTNEIVRSRWGIRIHSSMVRNWPPAARLSWTRASCMNG
jgi:hypothetical protein